MNETFVSAPAMKLSVSCFDSVRRKTVSVLIGANSKSIVLSRRKNCIGVVYSTCQIEQRNRNNTPMITLLRTNVTDVTELRKTWSHAHVVYVSVRVCVWKDKFSRRVSPSRSWKFHVFQPEFPPPNARSVNHGGKRGILRLGRPHAPYALSHARHRLRAATCTLAFALVVWIIR